MTPQQHHLGQLRAMLAFETGLAERLGAPGCSARRTAHDNAQSLTWAIETLREQATPPPSPSSGCWLLYECRCKDVGSFVRATCPCLMKPHKLLTMDDARRNAGRGNLTP